MSARRLVILVAGDPVEAVQRARGGYPDIILGALGDAWRGPHLVYDIRTAAPPQLTPGDALVISGSAANVPTREAWIVRAEGWLGAELRGGVPALGLCFGHQLIAHALGGEVAQNPRGREMGTRAIERLADDPLFEGLPRRFVANQSHRDTVSSLPEGAACLARNDRDAHQAVRFGERCYGVQFHPEFDGAIIRGFIAARREILAAEGQDADALAAAATDTPDARRVLANFVRLLG